MKTKDYIDILERIDFTAIKKHPNILVAASFWEPERYRAACTCYLFMRRIDDMIDEYKAAHGSINETEQTPLMARVEEWLGKAREQGNNRIFRSRLSKVTDHFRIPRWPYEDFARSMIYDIGHDGFPTLQSFLDYSVGASVAPSSIFVHLCGIRKSESSYGEPLFDVKQAATPCALFSYLVHIMRDFQKDQLDHLSYFPDDLLNRYGLTREQLSGIAGGEPIPAGFRDLMREYYRLADDYKRQTRDKIEEISPFLEPRYILSLNIIFNLYLMVFERIDPEKGTFTSTELNPTPAEIRERVLHTIQHR